MLRILIVENDDQIAELLTEMIEMEGGHKVVATASGINDAIPIIIGQRPTLALIDIHLGGHETGIEVAAKARALGTPALFTTATPLPFPTPELALGCLCKPYSCYAVSKALTIAERLIEGASWTEDVPVEFELY